MHFRRLTCSDSVCVLAVTVKRTVQHIWGKIDGQVSPFSGVDFMDSVVLMIVLRVCKVFSVEMAFIPL